MKKKQKHSADEPAPPTPPASAAPPNAPGDGLPSAPPPDARRDELPNRVSSPIAVAAVFRLTPPVGMHSIAAPAAVPAAASVASAPVPTTEDYAATLMRRLAAMAPPDFDDELEQQNDRRPLRERVRGRTGVADLLMFRIGDELFAADLASVEEAVTLPEIHHLPEMPAAMLGAFDLRGRLTPVYSPAHVLGVPLRGVAQAALLVRSDTRRLGLAVDDVEDVFQVDLATVHDSPGIDDADGILLAVAHHGTELVAIIDADALVAACIGGHALETA